MENGLRWHGFTIFHDGAQFVASHDASDAPVLEIGSQSVDRLLEMVEEHNHYIETLSHNDTGFVRAPRWLREWFESRDQLTLSDEMSFFAGDLVVQRVDGDKVVPDFGYHKSDQLRSSIEAIDTDYKRSARFDALVYDMFNQMQSAKPENEKSQDLEIKHKIFLFELKNLFKTLSQSEFLQHIISYHNPARIVAKEVIHLIKA